MGGSALWTADMLKMFGIKSRVLSMDIDLSLLDPVAKEYPDVTFIEGDSDDIEKYFPEKLLKVRAVYSEPCVMTLLTVRQKF